MSEVGETFVDGEPIKEASDHPFDFVDRPGSSLSEERFEFREGQLDWVEVWAIGRQVDYLSTGFLNRFPDSCFLMTGEVVQDHGVSTTESRDKLLSHISKKDFPVHRPVDYQRCGEACGPQSTDEGRRFPMAVWDF